MFIEMQSVVLVTPRTKDLLRLNHFRRETIRVNRVVRTVASLDELGTDAQELQVPHLLDCVSSEDF